MYMVKNFENVWFQGQVELELDTKLLKNVPIILKL